MERSDAIEMRPNGKASRTSEIEELEKIPNDGPVMETPPSEPSAAEEEQKYPDTANLILATLAFMIAVFLIALDVQILATAAPRITAEFKSLLDLSWYGGAYLLAQIALQPTYARLYQVFPIKHIFTSALVVLETGSVIGATARSSRTLIVGRAIQGTGAGGLMAGGLLMITYLVPKPQRPMYLSVVATMYAVAASLGPNLGGIFAESRVGWRFCFWLNLPVGIVAGIGIILAFPEPKRPAVVQPLKDKIMTLDPLGASLLISWVTCLLLALQRASIPQPWSDSGIWGPLLAFGIILCTFVILQFYQKDKAIIPYRILAQRTIAFSCVFETSLFLATTTLVYYLPFYFQSVKGFSPHKSGLFVLPFVVTNSAFAFGSGVLISKTGIYVPIMWLGTAVMMVGCGLIYTLTIDSTTGPIIGYQLIASAGFGLCVQVPFTAVQILPDKDIPIGNGLITFFQGLGGALAVSVAQTIFSNALHANLDEIPNINVDVIIYYRPSNLVHIPDDIRHLVQAAYGVATRKAFVLPIVGSGLALAASLFFERRRHYVPQEHIEEEERGVTRREVIEVKR